MKKTSKNHLTGKAAAAGATSAMALPQLTAPHRAQISALRALALPLFFILLLASFISIGEVRRNPGLFWAFAGSSAALLAWSAILFGSAVSRARNFTLEIVLKKQHYLQACLQLTLILYWGWHWRQVYDSAYLIAAQLIFAYAFDILLCWSRRDTYSLGFGPFPVIFSITLFFWFKDDWFYFQFLLVAVGFAAKELLRWNKDGRSTHIFNPSSFTLALFSVALLVTGRSDMTWGFLIANTEFYPPHMYVVLFLIGLPGQFLFGVTTMTMSAVVTTCLFSLVYFGVTGSYFFFDSYIPVAVFLGMHLLFTDPSTAPRTELGRVMFGVLYGLSTIVLYDLLLRAGMPGFYDKLLQVPLLNLSIQILDRLAQSKGFSRFDPAKLGQSLTITRRRLTYMSIWAVVFTGMSVAGVVDDRHPGQWLPFWQRACAQNAPHGCENLSFLENVFCQHGSGWACNEVGVLQVRSGVEPEIASSALQRGCQLGTTSACNNLQLLMSGSALQNEPPRLVDYPIILRGSKGPITERNPAALYALACEQGWPNTCDAQSNTTRGR
jgi:hypothetical protein